MSAAVPRGECFQEMHQHIPTRNTTHHRKTTVSFRDLCLLDIFATSLEALRYLKGGSDTTVQKQVQLALPGLCISVVAYA